MHSPPYEAACQAKEGQIIKPEELRILPFTCLAIHKVFATGVKYLQELGLPDEKHTHVIENIYVNSCETMVEKGHVL